MAQTIILLGRDIFGRHVNRRPRKILRKAFDDFGKQSGIHDDRRAGTQVARVRLLDEFTPRVCSNSEIVFDTTAYSPAARVIPPASATASAI
jgi:hypothetical protein